MTAVVKTYGNIIKYVDVNKKNKGMGYNDIFWGDYKIKGVYSLSFAFWCGDFLKELKGL